LSDSRLFSVKTPAEAQSVLVGSVCQVAHVRDQVLKMAGAMSQALAASGGR
jgi:hypothetical protein